jgi:hypothetical protein
MNRRSVNGSRFDAQRAFDRGLVGALVDEVLEGRLTHLDEMLLNPTSARLLPVNAEPATVSRSWQARTLRLTAAGPSADDAEARRSQVEQ